MQFISINKQEEHTSFCYSPLLGKFQLKQFYCRKGPQNFALNITLYPYEPPRQNHLVVFCVTLDHTAFDGSRINQSNCTLNITLYPNGKNITSYLRNVVMMVIKTKGISIWQEHCMELRNHCVYTVGTVYKQYMNMVGTLYGLCVNTK